MTHEDYMRRAIALAKEAAADGDVPVGCVLVKDDKIIAEGRNRREADGDATAHAEVDAIRRACEVLGTWRLHNVTMYVTLEPCPMCAGAIINSRISEVRYGARDDKAGACGSVLNLFEERFNHKPRLYGGLLEGECAAVLEDFFLSLRKTEENSSENLSI